MYKKILSKFNSFEKIGEGLNQTADAVKSTLGPQGQNVMIQHDDGRVSVTKDGVTVASLISFKDPLKNIGAQIIKDVASATVEGSGDGTTSASILTQAIFKEGRKNIAAGANSMEIKKGIDKAVSEVVKYLHSISQPVTDNDTLKRIATIASNNNEEIGTLIADAFSKVGNDGMITIEEGKSNTTNIRHRDGLSFDRGFESAKYITDHEKQECVLENPYILIYDKKITNIRDLIPLMSKWNPADSLLIISDDLQGEALATIVLNKMQGFKVCSVKAPLFGEWRPPVLDDISIVTGGTVISETSGLRLDVSLEQKGISILGKAEKIIVSKHSTVIFHGQGDQNKVKERTESLRSQLKEADPSGYHYDQIKKRLARITGGIATIEVGGKSEIEMREVKDRIDDALQATRAAQEEGVIPGGGVSLLRAMSCLSAVAVENQDQLTGVSIIRTALRAPLETILENAGEKVDVVINKIEGDANPNYGFNAKTRTYEDLTDTGIIDPVKVVRLCIENASSVAGMLLTSQTLIFNDSVAITPIDDLRPSGVQFEDMI